MPAAAQVAGFVHGEREGFEVLRFYVDDAFLILQLSGDGEKTAAGDDDAVLLEDVRRDDDVGDAGTLAACSMRTGSRRRAG